jgi:hypothetical protein
MKADVMLVDWVGANRQHLSLLDTIDSRALARILHQI